MPDEKMKELEQLCRPVANYLRNNWDPHCTVVISDSHIKLVRDEIGIPVRTTQEVPVQEQSSEKVIPLNNYEWINELAEKVATCLTTRGTLSKE